MTERKAGPVLVRDWGGKGVPTLLLHGMAAHAAWWDPVVPHLEGVLRPAALDFRGHGGSDWLEDGVYGADHWVEDIETARRALGFGRFLLVGHSMGARIALEYARRHGEALVGVAAVDFLAEVPASRERRARLAKAASQPLYKDEAAIVERFRLQPPGTTLGPEALAALGRRGIKKTDAGWTWKFDWRVLSFPYGPVWPQLPGINVPALIVRGERSEILPKPDMDRVARELKGARAADIPGAYHHVTLDAPEALADALKTFAASL